MVQTMSRSRAVLLVCAFLVTGTAIYAGEVESEVSFRDTLAAKKRTNILPEIEDKWLARDKALHLGASAAIVGLAYHSYHCQLGHSETDSRVLAISLSAVCGIGKELWDVKKSPRGLSWKDLVADGIGVAIGVLLFTL